MNPQAPDQYDPKQRVGNSLSTMQPGEVVICEIKRHPIGILTIYIMSGLMLVIVAALAFGVAPHLGSSDMSKQITQISAVTLLILTAICAVYSLIATKVYWGNSWVVTSDSLTQVNQTSLFNRQSSQLSLANLEDVTAEQNGILTHIFNYGLLKVETAGEHSKFQFLYCPNPNFYAQKILSAREVFEQGLHHGGGSQEQQQPTNGYPQPNQMPPNYPALTSPSDIGVNIDTEQ